MDGALWLISTAGLGFRFGLGYGFQSLWLHSIMQNMLPLTGLDPQDRSPSLLLKFQLGDQSLTLNQWKNPA